MAEEIYTKKCRLAGDMLHIQFTNGESYLLSLGEIVANMAGGLTKRAGDKCPDCGGSGFMVKIDNRKVSCVYCDGTGNCA